MSFLQANLSRILRVIGFVFTITFPAVYAASCFITVNSCPRGCCLPSPPHSAAFPYHGWEIFMYSCSSLKVPERDARPWDDEHCRRSGAR
ncbi:MAG: hypothetical protein ACLT4C_03365 [Butyricicoccus sp.]